MLSAIKDAIGLDVYLPPILASFHRTSRTLGKLEAHLGLSCLEIPDRLVSRG